MITRKTVFVLGAGANCPYGFPDGKHLIRNIIDVLPTDPNDNNNSFYYQFFEAYGTKLGDIRRLLVEFRLRLDNGGHTSIDSFLATHVMQQGYPEVGKFAVAATLLPFEFKHDFSRSGKRVSPDKPDQDWLSFLFDSMLHGCLNSVDDFIANNNVSFVTFNYDRTLEYFFCKRLESTYGISREAAWENTKRIRFIHVYGSLGEFHPKLLNRQPRPFQSNEIKVAAESIRLMYEDRQNQSVVENAITVILEAACVCFLGFAFDPDNVDRLKLNQCCGGAKFVLGTRFQVADGDWGRSTERMFPVAFNVSQPNRNWDALTFLRETRALG